MRNALFTATLLIFSSALGFAGDDRVATDVSGLEEAKAFSQQLLRDAADKEITVFHVGNKIPEELNWVILELDKAGHKVTVTQITEQDVLSDLEDDAKESNRWLAKLTYGKIIEPDTVNSINKTRSSFWNTTKLYWQSVFGLPKGFSFWFKIKRSNAEIKRDALGAAFQMALAGTSVALTFYGVGKLTGEPNHYIASGVALGVWHGLNMFFINNVLAIFGQGRMIKKISATEWGITKNTTLIRTLSLVRAMISNFIVLTGAFGPEAAFGAKSVWGSLKNSITTLFSRFWFDELSAKRQATISADGSVQVKEGQWSTKKMFWVRQIFEFTNGMLKNANLAELKWVSLVFPASGVYGVVKTVYQDKKSGWGNTKNIFRKIESNACSLILIKDEGVAE